MALAAAVTWRRRRSGEAHDGAGIGRGRVGARLSGTPPPRPRASPMSVAP